MDRKRPGRQWLVSASLLLLLICLLTVVVTAAGDQDTTTITGNVVDNTPPAVVTNLAVTSASNTSLTLTWTAPGDDDSQGTATEYDIRYSTSTITEANWDSATQCSGEPTPSAAGNTETLIVTGLSPGTTYYFGLKTADEVPNWSDLSNVPTGVTLSGGGGGGDGGAGVTVPECPEGEANTTNRATGAGLVFQSFVIKSFDRKFSLFLDEGITVLTPDGKCPRCIGIHEMTPQPSPPEGAHLIGPSYDAVPDLTAFTPPATIIYSYDLNDIPEGIAEENLVIALYDEATGEWMKLNCLVDTEAHTITAKIGRFYDMGVLGYEPEVPLPASFQPSSLIISPAEVETGETININVTVTNSGESTGSYALMLRIDGVEEESKEITLDAGASEQVSFSTSKDAAGTYSVDVNGLTGTFKVKPEPVAPVEPLPVEPTPAKPVNWWLIGWITAAALAFVGYLFRERLSPVVQRLSPVVQRLSPVVQRLSPVVQRLSPVVQRLSFVVQSLLRLLQRLSRLLPRKWGQAALKMPAELSPELWNKTYIDPRRVIVSNFLPGARAEHTLTIHNGKDEPAEFSITYQQPVDADEGYVMAPSEAQQWVIIADPTPVLATKETRGVLIAVEMPKGAKAPPKWEFWIVVKDVTQEGMAQTELVCKWLVTMRD